MANPWFKFYGSEYLSDPKMLALNASERSCWITLLCYASVSNDNGDDNENDNGSVRYLTEEQLMIQAGIAFSSEEWERTKGVLTRLEKLQMIRIDNGMITLINWQKRQQSSLTPYERVKRFREKKRNDNGDDNAMITIEEKRRDKKRIEEKRERETPHAKISYLSNLPSSDITEFLERFNASEKEIKSKAEDLKLYCERKGKSYRNYKSFLINALKRDFKERDETSIEGGKYKGL